jgi:hypothetical protein
MFFLRATWEPLSTLVPLQDRLGQIPRAFLMMSSEAQYAHLSRFYSFLFRVNRMRNRSGKT